MEIMVYGVRGSTPVPSVDTAFYGGNTACVSLRARNGALLFFDAGTGLREAAAGLTDGLSESGECHLFLSHGHLDHLEGLGFFLPLHNPAWTTHLYLPAWIETLPDSIYAPGSFPVPFSAFKGVIVRHPLTAGDTVRIANEASETRGDVLVECLAVNHPGGGLAYKAHADGGVFLYTGDHEITADATVRENTRAMLAHTDIAVVDATFTRGEYRPGWGHSCWEDWRDLAMESDAKCVLFSHHAPSRTDRQLDGLQRALRAHLPAKHTAGSPVMCFAREGMRLALPLVPETPLRETEQDSAWLERFLDDLAKYQDEAGILDRILSKAREICRADAGTVFLREGDDLLFAYTHNDSLFSVDSAYKYSYSSFRLPIIATSIAGYAAVTGEILNIADVRALPPGVPYSFNENFDNSTGYRTRSMLVVPFCDRAGKVVGVMQLINCLDPHHEVCAFSPGRERDIKVLAREIANVLERSELVRQGLYRVIRLTAVHDPLETGPHAERVGALAAALYQTRANKLGLDPDSARHEKSRIRLAAMLHDVGKIGVSDLVLKKPGKLTDEEFCVMRGHTRIGAVALEDEAATEDFSALARDIALHHHQKWNGRGYAGEEEQGKLAGEAIPLAARITALADVFDALVSPRCYKEPWSFERAMGLLREEAGNHFDPLLVECMEEILDVVADIYARFPDKTPAAPDKTPAAPGEPAKPA